MVVIPTFTDLIVDCELQTTSTLFMVLVTVVVQTWILLGCKYMDAPLDLQTLHDLSTLSTCMHDEGKKRLNNRHRDFVPSREVVHYLRSTVQKLHFNG